MWKIIRNLLYAVVLAILVKVVVDYIGNRHIGLLGTTTIACLLFLFLVIITYFEQALQWAIARVGGARATLARIFQRLQYSSHNLHEFSNLFDFDGEQVRLLYTCRSRIDEAPCPQSKGGGGRRLRHVADLHTAADEFLTFHLLLDCYRGQLLGPTGEELAKSFSCSHSLDELDRRMAEGKSWSRADVPELAYDNLVIIGESSYSNVILNLMKPLINFCPHYWKHGEWKARRPDSRVDLQFIENNDNEIDASQKANLHVDFSRGAGNAVAMICYGPNPFNLQKSVLILFGCHRVGQYLLELWLQHRESSRMFRKLLRNVGKPSYGQIVLYSPFEQQQRESFRFTNIQVMENRATRSPFFPFRLRSRRVAKDPLETDAGAVGQGPLLDISLILEIVKNHVSFVLEIERFLEEVVPIKDDIWVESKGRDVGLHITLYEFATYGSLETQEEARSRFRDIAPTLEQKLQQRMADVDSLEFSLVGCEVFPSSIVLNADLPTQVLDIVREECGTLSSGQRYFNGSRTPFPAHCTLVRFRRVPTPDEKAGLLSMAKEFRRREFGRGQIQTLSLILAKQRPFQDVDCRHEIKVTRRDRGPD